MDSLAISVIVSATKPDVFWPQHFQLHKKSSAKAVIMLIIELNQSLAVWPQGLSE